MDLLEQQGFIGPGSGAKPREIYGRRDSAPSSAGIPVDPRDLPVDDDAVRTSAQAAPVTGEGDDEEVDQA
jgi:hypothetical protein